MPDIGLTKAIGKAVRKGSKGAKVLRPAEQELLDREAKQAASAAPEIQAVPPAVIEEPAPSTLEPVSVPPQAPGAPVTPPAPRAVVDEPAALTPDELTAVHVDAFRLNRAKLAHFNVDELYQPNFDRITTTDDIKAVIADASQRNIGKVEEARRGVITNQQLQALAGDLDINQDVVRKVMERETGGILNAETILAARTVLNSSAARLKTLADKIAKGQGTDLEKVQFARQVQFHNSYQAQFMGARAEAGRALNAFNIPTGSDATQVARMAEIIGNIGGDVERLAKAVSLAESVPAVTKVVKPGLFIRSYQASQGFVNRVFVNGILSGPASHLANIGGNAVFQAMNTAEIALAARLGRFLGGTEHAQVGEALATLHGSLGATRDAFRLALRALKEGKTLDDVAKYEATEAPGGITGVVPETDRPYLGKLIRGIEEGVGVPTRLLGAEDDLFKTIAYRADMERQALLHVQEQIANGKASLQNAEQVAREFLENPTPEAQKAAEDWAREMTFQAPLGSAGQKAQLFLRSVPVLTLIAPFIRTPINIFKQGIARSPMAIFSARFWSAMQKGGRERDLAVTRFAVGSATSAYIAYLAANGDVTGAGPQNPKAKMIWEANGRRPYSVRVRNPITNEETWHSYARMEPLASVIGATADTTEIMSYLNSDSPDVVTDEESEAYNATGAIIAGIMNNTGNKTFMKGIADFVELTNDPTRNIKGWTNQMASSMVPYSALTRSIRNIEDPYLREAWTTIDKIRDNIPGYSKDLPPRLGLFGEQREKPAGSLIGGMSPFPESPQHYDEVYTELDDLMQQTREVPLSMPSKNVDGMRLKASEYADLVRIARSEPIFGGKTFREVVESTMRTAEYQRTTPALRVELLKSIQNQADKIARAPNGPLEQQNLDYADRISQWRLDQERARFGR